MKYLVDAESNLKARSLSAEPSMILNSRLFWRKSRLLSKNIHTAFSSHGQQLKSFCFNPRVQFLSSPDGVFAHLMGRAVSVHLT